MNYMDCKTLSEIAEVQTRYGMLLFALGIRTNHGIAESFAMTRACMATVMAWVIFEDAADQYLKSIPVTWTPPEDAREAA